MKILDAIERFGDACKGTSVSKEYDITVKLNSPKKEPRVIFRTAGTDSVKALKLAASTAIVVGGALIINAFKNRG